MAQDYCYGGLIAKNIPAETRDSNKNGAEVPDDLR